MKYLGIIIKTTVDKRFDEVRHDAVMSERFDDRVSADNWISNQKKNIEWRNKVLSSKSKIKINESMVLVVDESQSSKNYYDILAILILNFGK